MLISSNPVALAATRALEDAASTPAKPLQMELLRSMLVVERLTIRPVMAVAAPVDSKFERFFDDMYKDKGKFETAVYLTDTEKVERHYQSRLSYIDEKGNEMIRKLQASMFTGAIALTEAYMADLRAYVTDQYEKNLQQARSGAWMPF